MWYNNEERLSRARAGAALTRKPIESKMRWYNNEERLSRARAGAALTRKPIESKMRWYNDACGVSDHIEKKWYNKHVIRSKKGED